VNLTTDEPGGTGTAGLPCGTDSASVNRILKLFEFVPPSKEQELSETSWISRKKRIFDMMDIYGDE
jgi:hypothetical protein